MSQSEPAAPSTGPRVRTCNEDIGDGQLCGGKHLARGLCSKHYLRRYRIDDRPPLPPKGPPLEYIKISLTKEQKVEAKREARRRGLRTTELVRQVMADWLEKRKAGASSELNPGQ